MATTSSATEMIDVVLEPIYGVGAVSGLSRYGPRGFEGQISKDITEPGLRLDKTVDREITLADENTLFQAYLLHKFGDLNLPDDVKNAVYGLFDEFGRGNKTGTIVDYNKGDSGMRKTRDTDRRATVIVKASRFWREADGTVKYTPADDSEVLDVILPAPGYVEWTCNGDRDPRTGFGFSTNPNRQAAVKTWTDRGFPKDFAEAVVSYQFTRNEGAAGVDRRYFGDDHGRFRVGADWDPEVRGPGWGSFLASRSPSRARQAAGAETESDVESDKRIKIYEATLDRIEKEVAEAKRNI